MSVPFFLFLFIQVKSNIKNYICGKSNRIFYRPGSFSIYGIKTHMWSCIVGIVRCDVGGQPPAVSFVRMRAYGKGRMSVPWLPSATGLFRRVRVPAGQSHGTACAGAYRHGNTVCRACPLCTRGRFREGRGGVQIPGRKVIGRTYGTHAGDFGFR